MEGRSAVEFGGKGYGRTHVTRRDRPQTSRERHGKTWKYDASKDGDAVRGATCWFLGRGAGTSDAVDLRREDRPTRRVARSLAARLVRFRGRRLRRCGRMELPIPLASVLTNGSSSPSRVERTWTNRSVRTGQVTSLHPTDMPSGGHPEAASVTSPLVRRHRLPLHSCDVWSAHVRAPPSPSHSEPTHHLATTITTREFLLSPFEKKLPWWVRRSTVRPWVPSGSNPSEFPYRTRKDSLIEPERIPYGTREERERGRRARRWRCIHAAWPRTRRSRRCS